MLQLRFMIVDFGSRKKRWRYLVYRGRRLLLWILIWSVILLKVTWAQLEVGDLDYIVTADLLGLLSNLFCRLVNLQVPIYAHMSTSNPASALLVLC